MRGHTMSRTLDAEEFLSWLNEAEEELRSERRKEDQPDRKDDGILLATGVIREYVEKTCKINEAERVTGDGWIPADEKVPESNDRRWFMCMLVDSESDPPIFLQYEEIRGFGIWRYIYDSKSLTFVDSEFCPVEEMGLEDVAYWRAAPEPPERT